MEVCMLCMQDAERTHLNVHPPLTERPPRTPRCIQGQGVHAWYSVLVHAHIDDLGVGLASVRNVGTFRLLIISHPPMLPFLH